MRAGKESSFNKMLSKTNFKNKKSQIWVETVIYTLIGLAIIGVLLSVVKPTIDQKKDQAVIEQSLQILDNIKTNINDISYYGAGNSRPIDLKISKGELMIDGENDLIRFYVKSSFKYSEPGINISLQKINVTTILKGTSYDIYLVLNYKNQYNLTWQGRDIKKVFATAPTSYNVGITNYGKNSGIPGQLVNIDFR